MPGLGPGIHEFLTPLLELDSDPDRYEKTKALLADLLAYPDVKPQWTTPIALSFMPVIPLSFVHQGTVLNYFSMVTTVGTPQTVAAQELRMECMFPADAETEARHGEMMGKGERRKRGGGRRDRRNQRLELRFAFITLGA